MTELGRCKTCGMDLRLVTCWDCHGKGTRWVLFTCSLCEGRGQFARCPNWVSHILDVTSTPHVPSDPGLPPGVTPEEAGAFVQGQRDQVIKRQQQIAQQQQQQAQRWRK
jgi:hypothetical protein